MSQEKVNATDASSASVTRGGPMNESLDIHGHYDVVCTGADGVVKWEDSIENLVVTVGKNNLLDNYFSGSTYTAAWFMGLTAGGTSYIAGDTLAVHPGWLEDQNYTGLNRITVTWAAASGGSKVSAAAVFNITATTTINGAMLTNSQLKTDNTGILYSAGNFVVYPRSVISGDVLSVTYTASV